jgi:hypothetical protein
MYRNPAPWRGVSDRTGWSLARQRSCLAAARVAHAAQTRLHAAIRADFVASSTHAPRNFRATRTTFTRSKSISHDDFTRACAACAAAHGNR